MKDPEQETDDRIALLFRTAAERKKAAVILCEGADLLAIKKFISRINQILDPRHYKVLRPGRKRTQGLPFLHRYWLHLPAAGDLLICEHGYYHDWIMAILVDRIGRNRRDQIIAEITGFENDMAAAGTLVHKIRFPGSPSKVRRDYAKKITGTHREAILSKRYKAVIESTPRYQALLASAPSGTGELEWNVIPEGDGNVMTDRALGTVIAALDKFLEIDSLAAVRNFDEAMSLMRRKTGGTT